MDIQDIRPCTEERGICTTAKALPWCNSTDARETGDIHLPWQSLFASPFPPHPRRVSPSLSLSRLDCSPSFWFGRVLQFIIGRLIYAEISSLPRPSVSRFDDSASLLLPAPPCPATLPGGWILSQTQSGAPLRAKSEDMIARECLVFYKIGYPSWEILRERERPNFCSSWIALRRPLPFDSTVAFRSCFGTFRKIPCNLLKISCLFRRRLGRKYRRCWSHFYKRNPHKR